MKPRSWAPTSAGWRWSLRFSQACATQVGAAAARVLALAGRIAAADVVAALAEQAHRHGFCRPVVDDSEVLELGTAGTRWWNVWRPPAASCPMTCAWIPSASRFSS